MAFSIRANFFCLFKTCDNIKYNLDTLSYLYEIYANSSEYNKKKLLKPIILIEISIIEAILHDFHLRIRANRNEGVVGMGQTEIDYIRSKNIDELSAYISSARKHNFFDESESNFYVRLDELRVIRNRVHIQNSKFLEPRDESAVFREEVKISSEKCLEKVVKTISRKHSRPSYLAEYVGVLVFPWDEHLLPDGSLKLKLQTQ